MSLLESTFPVEREGSDSRLLRNLLRELESEPRLEAAEVVLEVENGRVRLSGCVDSFNKKLAARDVAHRLGGVVDVVDDIQVSIAGSPAPTDEDLKHAIREALAWDVFLTGQRIAAVVEAEWVILEGTVETPEDRADAENIARSVAGVRGVLNHLEIAPPPDVEMGQLRMTVEKTLLHLAEREAGSIQLSVREGVVFLSGVVHCRREREEILSSLGQASHRNVVAESLLVET